MTFRAGRVHIKYLHTSFNCNLCNQSFDGMRGLSAHKEKIHAVFQEKEVSTYMFNFDKGFILKKNVLKESLMQNLAKIGFAISS